MYSFKSIVENGYVALAMSIIALVCSVTTLVLALL